MNTINLARWITADVGADDYSTRMFQRTVRLEKPVKKAIFNVTALNMYEAYINNEQVGKQNKFMPGWTHYKK